MPLNLMPFLITQNSSLSDISCVSCELRFGTRGYIASPIGMGLRPSGPWHCAQAMAYNASPCETLEALSATVDAGTLRAALSMYHSLIVPAMEVSAPRGF